jgi:hypothetical protein
MPADNIGQLITFSAQMDPNMRYTEFVYVRARANDTIRKIAARRGHPEMVNEILALNSDVRIKNGHFLRSATQVLKRHSVIRLPGTLKQGDTFSVHADDPRPIVKDGYATYDTIDRPGRVGLRRFKGYNPIALDIPVQFEGYANDAGAAIEADIEILERMAGRGPFAGAASGPPSVIRVSVTNNTGQVVWLVPAAYQWSANNPTAPLYRIDNITWAAGALSDDKGQRTRAKAVISVSQYTAVSTLNRSATQRARARAS